MARPLHLPDYFQKVDFKALYKIHGQKQKGLRLLALSYLQEGRSVKETSSLLFKTEYTVREWVQLYDEGGGDALLSIRPGRGRKAKLPSAAEPLFKNEITNLSESLKGGRIRAEDIRLLLKEKFQVDYGLSGIYSLLHRLGYSWITARSIHPKAGEPPRGKPRGI